MGQAEGRKKETFLIPKKTILNQLCEELERFKRNVKPKIKEIFNCIDTVKGDFYWCWSVGKLHLSCSHYSSPPNKAGCAL